MLAMVCGVVAQNPSIVRDATGNIAFQVPAGRSVMVRPCYRFHSLHPPVDRISPPRSSSSEAVGAGSGASRAVYRLVPPTGARTRRARSDLIGCFSVLMTTPHSASSCWLPNELQGFTNGAGCAGIARGRRRLAHGDACRALAVHLHNAGGSDPLLPDDQHPPSHFFCSFSAAAAAACTLSRRLDPAVARYTAPGAPSAVCTLLITAAAACSCSSTHSRGR